MTKTLKLLVAALTVSMPATAQMKVSQNGNVMIGNGTTSNAVSRFAIGDVGTTGYNASVKTSSSFKNGLSVRNDATWSSNSTTLYLNTSNVTSTVGTTMGLGSMFEARGTGQCIGLMSTITGTSSCSKIGVLANIPTSTSQSMKAAAIFGSVGTSNVMSYYGSYAGYFKGDVLSTGNIYGTFLSNYPSNSQAQGSQANSVTGVEDWEATELVSRLSEIPMVQYTVPAEEVEDGLSAFAATEEGAEAVEQNEESQSGTVRHSESDVRYALDIEKLKESFPEFVYEDKDGNASIDYIGMIPILVQSIGKLQNEISLLKKGDEPVKAPAQSDVKSVAVAEKLSMAQNRPNPFESVTEIKLTVPAEVGEAYVMICDMNGKMLKKIDIAERGAVNVTVNASDLYEGMFLYSLIADNEITSTKKMIIK